MFLLVTTRRQENRGDGACHDILIISWYYIPVGEMGGYRRLKKKALS